MFICGLLGASCLEVIHCCFWIHNKAYGHSDPNLTKVTICNVFHVVLNNDVEYVVLPEEGTKSRSSANYSIKMSKVLIIIWRYFPDLVAFAFCILMSNIGSLEEFSKNLILYWIGVPYIVLLYLVSAMLQVSDFRHNCSRLILESNVLNLLGHISFPLYLLQRLYMEQYLPLLYTYIEGPLGDTKTWFDAKSIFFRLFWLSTLIFLSWLVQKVLTDILVGYLYGAVLPILNQWKTKESNNKVKI